MEQSRTFSLDTQPLPDRNRAQLESKSDSPIISNPESEIASHSENKNLLYYVGNLVRINTTSDLGVGVIYGDLLVTASNLIYEPIKNEKFFSYYGGSNVEITCKVRSVADDISVLKIEAPKDLPPKPRTELDHQFSEGEMVQILHLEDSEPGIEPGKIHIEEDLGDILVLTESGRTFFLGTPVFNNEGIWVGLVTHSYFAGTTIVPLSKYEMTRDCPPRLKIALLNMVIQQEEIAEEIAKFPSKWHEIAVAYQLRDESIAKFERIENEVKRVLALMWHINWSPVPLFKKILTDVGLQSIPESELLKNEDRVWD